MKNLKKNKMNPFIKIYQFYISTSQKKKSSTNCCVYKLIACFYIYFAHLLTVNILSKIRYWFNRSSNSNYLDYVI